MGKFKPAHDSSKKHKKLQPAKNAKKIKKKTQRVDC